MLMNAKKKQNLENQQNLQPNCQDPIYHLQKPLQHEQNLTPEQRMLAALQR